jgi:hypothetical protein
MNDAAGASSCSLRYRQTIYGRSLLLVWYNQGIVVGSTTMTANRLAGSLSLAFSLILWCEPGSSCQLSPTW